MFCNFRQFRWLFPEKLQHLTHWKSKLQFGRLVGKILCQKYDPYPYANPPKVGQTMKMGTTVMKTLMHLQEVSQSWKKMPGALVPAKKAPFFPVHLCDWTYHQTITCPAGIRILHQGERDKLPSSPWAAGVQDSVIEDTNPTSYAPSLSTQKLLELNMGQEQNLTLLEVYLDLIIKLVLFMTTSLVPFLWCQEGVTALILQINHWTLETQSSPPQMPVVLHSRRWIQVSDSFYFSVSLMRGWSRRTVTGTWKKTRNNISDSLCLVNSHL